MELLCCNCSVDSKALDSVDWTTIISSLVSVVAAGTGIFAIVFSYFQFKKTIELEKMREERKQISEKLNAFYGPLLQLRMKSEKLYEKFRKKFVEKDPNFRTLTYLLDGHEFEGNDKKLLEEILLIGRRCEELMHAKAGLIDDEDLQLKHIPRATTHYLVLRLAYEKSLKGHADEFRDATFPRELDDALKKKKKELESRLDELNKTV